MRIASIVFSVIPVWSCLVGCSNKPLQDHSPAGGGGISVDGGGGGGIGGQSLPPADGGTPDTSPAGQRSYLVTSLLQRDGGIIGSAPTSHTFTLVLGADRRTAIAGGTAAEGKSVSLDQTASGALHVAGALSLAINADSCSGSSVTYSDLTFTVDASDRLTGTGSGTLFLLQGDTVQSVSATMSLTSAADTQAPTLRIAGGFSDPLLPFSVQASEPLPPSASATLRAKDGETFPMSADGVAGSFVTKFQKPAMTLRYGMRYDVVVDALTDFAGNAAINPAGLYFFTKALPPIAPEDGFESVTGTTFAGVSVLSSADSPVITGTKSLYIPPANSGTSANPPTQPELALRLPIEAGDTAVRFSYRTVKLSNSLSYGASWALGRERGAAVAPTLPADTGTTTDVSIGGKTWTLGPITTASFDLPAGAAGEVVLQRTFSSPTSLCGFPPPPAVSGIIIDDLRAE